MTARNEPERLTPEFVREAIRQLKEVALKPDENGFYRIPIPEIDEKR